MMVLTLLVVAGFRDPLAISNAYGARPLPLRSCLTQARHTVWLLVKLMVHS